VINRVLFTVLLLILFLTISSIYLYSADLEEMAHAAEQTGKTREALTYYKQALQSAPEGSDLDRRLRGKIVSLILKLRPATAIAGDGINNTSPERSPLRDVTLEQDYLPTEADFPQVMRSAPGIVTGPASSGPSQESSGANSDTIRRIRPYLPAPAESDETKQESALINQMRYLQNKAVKDASTAQATGQTIAPRLIVFLGKWNFVSQSFGSISWGTVSFIINGQIIEAYKSTIAYRILNNPLSYGVDHTPVLWLRMSSSGSDTVADRWEYFRTSDSPACRTKEGFVPVNPNLSPDRRQLTLQLVRLRGQDSPMVCVEDSELMTLTRP
jgi:hypothetical protein